MTDSESTPISHRIWLATRRALLLTVAVAFLGGTTSAQIVTVKGTGHFTNAIDLCGGSCNLSDVAVGTHFSFILTYDAGLGVGFNNWIIRVPPNQFVLTAGSRVFPTLSCNPADPIGILQIFTRQPPSTPGIFSANGGCSFVSFPAGPAGTIRFTLQLSGPGDLFPSSNMMPTAFPPLSAYTPDSFTTLKDFGKQFGFDHFNWVSSVMFLPASVNDLFALQPIASTLPLTAPPPFLDPPLGGYTYQLSGSNFLAGADFLPYYWDEQPFFNPDNFLDTKIENGTQLDFGDHAHSSLLGPSDYIQFATTLVGVKGPEGILSKSSPLATFTWSTNNQIAGTSNLAGSDPVDSGTGGIFNVQIVQIDDLPVTAREVLIQAGVEGITNIPGIDNIAPMTTAFFSGNHGTNGWFRSLVETSLIATDIDGPADIASTSYTLDGSSHIIYSVPFAIAGDGIHNLEFGSTDIAGNVETPRPSRVIKIDSTPPTITPSRSPAVNASGWNNTDVTFSFACSDALSGLAPGSPALTEMVGNST